MRPIDRALNQINEELKNIMSIVLKIAKMVVEGNWDYVEIRKLSGEAMKVKDSIREVVIRTIARYQPTASDLYWIFIAYEMSYGLYRFTRYALDISRMLSYFKDTLEEGNSKCILNISKNTLPIVIDMITLTINAFNKPSKDIIERIIELEKNVDELYREAIEKTHTSANTCSCIDLVTVIFLERMADHGSYIAQKLMETMKS
jgi:phosphate uptake regulator